MRMLTAILVLAFGLVTFGAGAVAMYNHAILADETDISGFNPALWIVLFGSASTVLVGVVQLAQAIGATMGPAHVASATSD